VFFPYAGDPEVLRSWLRRVPPMALVPARLWILDVGSRSTPILAQVLVSARAVASAVVVNLIAIPNRVATYRFAKRLRLRDKRGDCRTSGGLTTTRYG
jgi:hypothetical protein